MTERKTDPAESARPLERREDHFYDELTRTNNELANLHRAMAVANAELREAQRALRTSEQRYRNLSACAPLGVLELTASGECGYANAAWQSITGLAEAASLGDGWLRALEGQGGEDLVASLRIDVNSGHELARELRLVTTTGESRWVEVRSRALDSVNGDARGSVCTIQDITARRQAEAELARVHVMLVDASRRAGMAEVAAGVLHKIGTALTSLNMASSSVGENLRSSTVANVARVVALLEAHHGELGEYLGHDPQGIQLGGYLARLSDDLAAEQATAFGDLAQLQLQVEKIKEIVGAYEALTDRGGRTETVIPAEALARALRITAPPPTVRIIENFEPVPTISVDKYKLEQVLLELLRNAVRSCQDADAEGPRIELTIARVGERVRFRFAHNGSGIPPDALTRIFTQGFSGGAGLFELHDAAIAATEMGGSLHAHSEGLDRGAQFTLELPAGGGELP